MLHMADKNKAKVDIYYYSSSSFIQHLFLFFFLVRPTFIQTTSKNLIVMTKNKSNNLQWHVSQPSDSAYNK